MRAQEIEAAVTRFREAKTCSSKGLGSADPKRYTEEEFQEKVRQVQAQYAALYEKRMQKQVTEHRQTVARLQRQNDEETKVRLKMEKQASSLLSQFKSSAMAHQEALLRQQKDHERDVASLKSQYRPEDFDALKAECARLSAELVAAKTKADSTQELVEAERRRVTASLKEQYKNIIKMYQSEAKAAANVSKVIETNARSEHSRSAQQSDATFKALESKLKSECDKKVADANRERDRLRAELQASKQKFYALEGEMVHQFELYCSRFEEAVKSKAADLSRTGDDMPTSARRMPPPPPPQMPQFASNLCHLCI